MFDSIADIGSFVTCSIPVAIIICLLVKRFCTPEPVLIPPPRQLIQRQYDFMDARNKLRIICGTQDDSVAQIMKEMVDVNPELSIMLLQSDYEDLGFYTIPNVSHVFLINFPENQEDLDNIQALIDRNKHMVVRYALVDVSTDGQSSADHLAKIDEMMQEANSIRLVEPFFYNITSSTVSAEFAEWCVKLFEISYKYR